MAMTEYTHQEKEQIFEQFKLLPEEKRLGFLNAVTNNPDISANANKLAAGMQGLINEHVAAQSAQSFGALLGGERHFAAMAAYNPPVSGNAVPTLDSARRGQLASPLVALTQQATRDDGMGGLA